MMITPTMEEVKLAAAKIGMPDLEAQKFFHYYESVGWRVGKSKMVSFQNALAGWKLRWMERGGADRTGCFSGSVGTSKTWAQREIDRICRREGC